MFPSADDADRFTGVSRAVWVGVGVFGATAAALVAGGLPTHVGPVSGLAAVEAGLDFLSVWVAEQHCVTKGDLSG